MSFFSNRRSVRRRLGLQEQASMPLFGYFGAIGTGLTVFLLFLNFALEPVKPQPPRQPPIVTARNVTDWRTTTGHAQPMQRVPDSAAASSEFALQPEQSMATLPEVSQQQQSTAVRAKQWLPSKRAKRTSGKKRTESQNTDAAWHFYGRPHSGYAKENSWSAHSFPGPSARTEARVLRRAGEPRRDTSAGSMARP